MNHVYICNLLWFDIRCCLSIFRYLLLLIVRLIYYLASQKCLAKSGNNVLNNRFEGGDWYMMINHKRLNLLRHSIQSYINHIMYPVRYNCFVVWQSIRSYLHIKWIHGVNWAIFFSFLVLWHIAIHCRIYSMAVQKHWNIWVKSCGTLLQTKHIQAWTECPLLGMWQLYKVLKTQMYETFYRLR